VSVVIPAYNREASLPRALASVWGQAPRPPAEVIVVDDGSRDRTAEVAAALGARVIRHERNSGAAAARNTGIAAARHEWIALLDSDDEWFPHHLEHLWSIRDGHVLVAGSGYQMREDPRRDSVSNRLLGAETKVLTSPAAIIARNPIPASAVLARRDAVLEVGGYDTSLGYSEDFDLWIRLLERGTAVLSQTPVMMYHTDADQKSAHGSRPREAQRRIIDSYADRPWWPRRASEYREGMVDWNEAVRHARSRRPLPAARAVGRLVARPGRLGQVLRARALRSVEYRRSGRYARDGLPSIALLPMPPAAAAAARARVAGRPVTDLSGVGTARALWRVARRPPSSAYVGSGLQARVVRLVGVRPMPPGGDGAPS
jgi:glycosyltransferase involved in cell wall biosynthesis